MGRRRSEGDIEEFARLLLGGPQRGAMIAQAQAAEQLEEAMRLVERHPEHPGCWGAYITCLIEAHASPMQVLHAARKAVDFCPDAADIRPGYLCALLDAGFEIQAHAANDEAFERFGARYWKALVKARIVKSKQRTFMGWRRTTMGVQRVMPDDGESPAARPTRKATREKVGRGQPPAASRPRPLAPPDPVPEPDWLQRARLPDGGAGSVPVVLSGRPDMTIVDRLVTGDADGVRSVLVAVRAAGVLVDDGFDRLFAPERTSGVDSLGYQIETVLKVLRRFRGRVLLSDEVGLGKTVEACLVLSEYLARRLVRRCLVLVPPSLVSQWRAELSEKFGIDSIASTDDALRKDPDGFWAREGVIVASMATARKAEHRRRIAEQRFDMLIVDEAHNVKNRSTAAWRLVDSVRSRYCLMLTATPVETDLGELFNLVTLLRPGTLGTEQEFRSRFVDPSDPSRPRDPEKLRALLSEVMIRNTRATCGVVLPPRTARTLRIEPTAQERSLYERLVELSRGAAGRSASLIRLLMEEAGSSPAAVASTAARAAASGASELSADLEAVAMAAAAVDATAKLDALLRLVPGDPLLVFSRFRATLELVAAALRRAGTTFATFTGDTACAQRDEAVELFARGGAHVLLCSGIGGEGRNLQFCHRLVNFDIPWNPMQIEQRIGRIHRIGQTEAVEVTNLALAGSAEDRILRVIDERLNLFELVVGEMDMVLGEMTDERDFEDRVYDIYATSRDEADVEQGFERLATKIGDARHKLDRARALDEALFGEDYGT